MICLGGVGIAKTDLAVALAHTACLRGTTTLFASAVDIVNSLAGAQATGGIKRELARLTTPSLLLIDKPGYPPIDQFGADALFQLISKRYERGSTVFKTNRAFKLWPEIFQLRQHAPFGLVRSPAASRRVDRYRGTKLSHARAERHVIP